MQAKARAVNEPNGTFQTISLERRELGPHDVLIAIHYVGICHTDIHIVRQEWRETDFPLVPGHEIAGIVSEVGSSVSKYKPGDRVGVGCMVNACGTCEYCKAGKQQFCENRVSTYGDHDQYNGNERTQGGYASHIVVTEDFVLRIPDGLELDVAAPLLCAGITTYSPLRHWQAGANKKVAVVGLGGLGHMAVQIAHAMGAEVSVLSHSDKKRQDSQTLGADHYYDTSEPETAKALKSSFDLIINTVSAKIDINQYLSFLRPEGTLVNVGVPAEPLSVNAFSLVGGRRSFAGSVIGGIPETQEMLDFCAEHGIGAQIETIAADQIDEAYDRVVNSDVRYRFVIDTATI